MMSLDFEITIGKYKVKMVDSIVVKSSVENLTDVATINLPATAYNKAMEIESKINEGDSVTIRFGYNAHLVNELPIEFTGYVESIVTDNGLITINCQDDLILFRKGLENKSYPEEITSPDIALKDLIEDVLKQVGSFELSCDYDLTYSKYTIYNLTGIDFLKNIQKDTGANIYFRDKTLHVHPRFGREGSKAIYDFAVNVEKSNLKYDPTQNKKCLAIVQGTKADGTALKVSEGSPEGEIFTVTIPGVSDEAQLKKRAAEIVDAASSQGYSGDLTGWLIPQVKPGDIAEIRDTDYPTKNGEYYIVSVESSFSANGGSRKITIGKKTK